MYLIIVSAEICPTDSQKYERVHNMTRMWGRKMSDLAHAEFVSKLEYVARKYGVTVHKIDRFYPSSKTCECGYVNKNLKLKDREWVCPECGKVNDRDLNAAENILRRGISELWGWSKTVPDTASHVCTQVSHRLQTWEYVKNIRAMRAVNSSSD